MPHGKVHNETPYTVSAWAENTFGPTRSNFSCVARANKEMSELLSLLAKDDKDPKIGEEIADIIIVLWRTAMRANVDIQGEINRKMAKNRNRKWRSTGDGHGQHIPESELINED